MAEKLDVWISITGVQTLDGESDIIELTTAGKLETAAEGYRLSYEESPVTGLDGAVTTLHVGPGQVLLERSGALNSLLVLEPGKRHQSRYETPYGSLMMGVHTEALEVDLDESGGTLAFVYTTDMNGIAAGRHEVRVAVRPA